MFEGGECAACLGLDVGEDGDTLLWEGRGDGAVAAAGTARVHSRREDVTKNGAECESVRLILRCPYLTPPLPENGMMNGRPEAEVIANVSSIYLKL